MRTKRRAFLVHLPVLNFNRFDWICMTILQHINSHFISYCLHTKLRFWFGFNIKKPSGRETWWCLWTFVSKVRRGEKTRTVSRKCYIISKLEEQSLSGSPCSSQNFWTGLNVFGDPENHYEDTKNQNWKDQIDANYFKLYADMFFYKRQKITTS